MKIEDVSRLVNEVIDPNTGIGLASSGKIHNLRINEKNIDFDLLVSNVEPILKGELNLQIVDIFEKNYPEYQVNVNMISNDTLKMYQDEQNTGDNNEYFKMLIDLGKNPLPHIKNVIAVASGKGGVGKSSVAVNLAMALKDLGLKVGLLDADMYGPSIPTMLNLKGKRPGLKRVYNLDKLTPIEAFGLKTMSIGFFVEPEQAIVLRGPKLDGVMKQFIKDVVWPEMDYLIIDLPPGTGDVQLSLVQQLSVTGVVMVTTPQRVSYDDAIKAMNMFLISNVDVPILGVVENMAWFTPDDAPDKKYFIFGHGAGKELADKGESELLIQIPIFETIREGGDNGNPVYLVDKRVMEIYKELAVKIDKLTNIRNEIYDKTKIVERSS